MAHEKKDTRLQQFEVRKRESRLESKTISSIVVSLTMLLIILPGIVLSATESSSTGSFTINNVDPAITSVQLWSTGTSPAQAITMTPQVQYNVKVAINDLNTLDDLTTVKVTIYYDTDGSYDEGDRPDMGNTQTGAILTWTNSGSWSIDPNASTTWSVISGSCSQPSLSGTTGTFEFHFKPGKVATETPGAAEWHIYAIATDNASATGDFAQDDREMNWYSEITNLTATADFGTVPLGCTGSPSSAVSATYISNGAYDEQIKTDTPWVGQTSSGTISLYTSGTGPGQTQFALKADDDATVADAVQVLSASYTTIDNSGTQTGESGDTQTNNYLWLWLGSTGIQNEEYQGTVYLKIADGS